MFLLYNFPLQMQLNLKKLPKCQNDINVYQPSGKRKLKVSQKCQQRLTLRHWRELFLFFEVPLRKSLQFISSFFPCFLFITDIKFHDPNDPSQYQQNQPPQHHQQQNQHNPQQQQNQHHQQQQQTPQAHGHQGQQQHGGGHHHDHQFGEKLDQEWVSSISPEVWYTYIRISTFWPYFS